MDDPRRKGRIGARRSPVVSVAAAAALLLACGPRTSDASGRAGAPRESRSAISGAPSAGEPFVRVLGTVQDGGLPHAACACDRCRAAQEDPGKRRRVASLAICIPRSGSAFLVDATPDLREQLWSVMDGRELKPARRRRPVDGIFLGHAHIGHYLGLAYLGFESAHTDRVPVFATPRMAAFLRKNAPWDLLVRLNNIEIRETAAGETVSIDDEVTVSLVPVPHREEYTDTVGFRIRGPKQTLLYVSDTDGWDAWDPPLTEVLDGVDVALLDGTFYSMDELPGRDVSAIGHPLITRTMDLLQEPVLRGEVRVYFTHLNHSNPALDPEGDARKAMEARGFRVLDEGVTFPL